MSEKTDTGICRKEFSTSIPSQATVAVGSGSGRPHCHPSRGQLGQTERNFHVGYKLYLPETFQCRLLYSNCLSLINGIPTFLVIHRNMKVCYLSETILTTTATPSENPYWKRLSGRSHSPLIAANTYTGLSEEMPAF